MRGLALVLVLILAAAGVAAAPPEAVRFASRDGTLLDGYLFAAAGEGRRPALVMLHGCGGMWTRSGRMGESRIDWGERFARAGIHALQVDSFRPRGIDEVCTRQVRPITAVGDRPNDAYGALDYLKGRADTDPARIGVVGWSHGGSAALGTIASNREPRGFALAIAFYPGCTLEGAYRSTIWSAYAPVLMLLGAADDWTPAIACHRLAARAEGRGAALTLRTYDGAHHGFDVPSGQVRAREVRNAGQATTRTVHAGRDPVARQAALAEVEAFLTQYFRPN